MTTERSALLQQSISYGTEDEAARPTPFSLRDESRSLLEWTETSQSKHSTGPSSIRPVPSDPAADLVVLLYALHLLSRDVSGISSIRKTLKHSVAGQLVQAYLCDAIEDLLDTGGSAVLSDQANAEEEEDADISMWRSWPVVNDSREHICAIDLLLPPYVPWTKTSPFLSHPLIRHVLEHTWYNGGTIPKKETASTLSRLKCVLETSITPSRAHLLHLASFLILYYATIFLSVRPPIWIFPYTPEDERERYSAVEVIWAIWTIALFIDLFQRKAPLVRCILLLPTFFTVLFIPINVQSAYSFLTTSIPALTMLFILPTNPSLPFLSHSLLPLSTLLLDMLHRSTRSATLLMPLVLALLLLFAWSMNGDIFRGFYRSVLPPPPMEPGIAPFEARLWIFITVILLFIFSVTLTVSRAIMPIREGWDNGDVRRWKGAVKEGDEWEKEYGVTVARLSRRRFGLAVQELVQLPVKTPGVNLNALEPRDAERAEDTTSKADSTLSPEVMRGSRPVVVPINLVCLPLDIACIILDLVARIGLFSSRGLLTKRLRVFREELAIGMMGPLCFSLRLIRTLRGGNHACD